MILFQLAGTITCLVFQPERVERPLMTVFTFWSNGILACPSLDFGGHSLLPRMWDPFGSGGQSLYKDCLSHAPF